MIDKKKSFNTGYIIFFLFYGDYIRCNLCEKMDPAANYKEAKALPASRPLLNM